MFRLHALTRPREALASTTRYQSVQLQAFKGETWDLFGDVTAAGST
jgi:hypothetical protein